jgi:hypothetical protein
MTSRCKFFFLSFFLSFPFSLSLSLVSIFRRRPFFQHPQALPFSSLNHNTRSNNNNTIQRTVAACSSTKSTRCVNGSEFFREGEKEKL